MAVGTNTKPYRLQDPQSIAMEYGGDKQKIARAMQLGIIDPTAGTLAGMFIDKMRSAAQAEQQSQMTVAQKTFAPPAPPAPPQGAPAGLGATPQAAQMGQMGQMMPPQGGAPMPPQSPEQMQPMNMAKGGEVRDQRFSPSGREDNPDFAALLASILQPRNVGPFSVRGEMGGNRPDASVGLHAGPFSAEHQVRGNSTNYNVDMPLAGGRVHAGANASHGFKPDSAELNFMHKLFGGDVNVGGRYDRNGPSAHIGYAKDFAEGGLVAFGGGGLSDLPVPDTMFDEPSNGSYAGGGIVAFAPGGATYADFSRVIPIQESRGNYTAVNPNSGALGKYQVMPDTARALAKRLGLEYAPSLMSSGTPEGRTYQEKIGPAAMQEAWAYGKGDSSKAAAYYQGGPNTRGWGANNRQYVADIQDRLAGREPTRGSARGAPTPASGAPAGMAGMPTAEDYGIGMKAPSITDLYKTMHGDVEKMFSPPEHKYSDAARTALEKEIAPEAIAKQDKQDFWMHIANMGAAMMSTKSPSFLGAVGESLQGTLGDYQKLKKEHRNEYRQNLASLAGIEDASNKDKRTLESLTLGYIKDQAGLLNENQRDQLAALGRRANDRVQVGLEQLRITAQGARDAAGNATSISVANINQGGAEARAAAARAIEAAKPPNMTDANRETLQTQLNSIGAAAAAADAANKPDEVRRLMTQYYEVQNRTNDMARESGFAPVSVTEYPLPNFGAGVGRGEYGPVVNPRELTRGSLGAGAPGAVQIISATPIPIPAN